MPTPADFFLFCVYLLIGSVIVAVCIMLIGTTFIELRKRWPK